MILTVGLFTLLLFILSIIFFSKPTRKYFEQRAVYDKVLPIPKTGYVPFFGHLAALGGQVSKRDHFQAILKFCEEYPNEPMFCIWFFLWPALIFHRLDYLEAFFAAGTKNTSKSPDYALLDDWLHTGLLTSGGQKWKTRRRIITPSFHDNNLLANCIDTFNEQLGICLQQFERLAEQGEEINLYRWISAWTLDVICDTAMGKSIGVQVKESEYGNAVLQMTELLALRMRSPWLWPRPIFKLSSTGREHDRVLNTIHRFTRQVIQDRIESFSNTHVQRRMAFLDTLIAQMHEEKLTLDDVQEEVDTFMFEGHDTTATALYFAMFMIALHPDVQNRIVEEMTNIFGDDDQRPCTVDDVRQMDYLERVIKESLRLLPSVPMIGREIQETFEYDGKTFLKGTTAIIFIYGIHRDPRHFPDPEKFDPDRFLPELVQQRHPFAYIPFSAGPRNCIGQRFALLEEKVFLSTVLRRFHLSTSQTLEDFVPTEEIILRSNTALRVKLTRRQS